VIRSTTWGEKMTATAVAEPVGIRALGQERDQAHGTEPSDKAPKQTGHQAVVRAVAPLVVRPIHDITVLSVIAVVQLGWLTILGYVVSAFSS
jgi:hypothetical protein